MSRSPQPSMCQAPPGQVALALSTSRGRSLATNHITVSQASPLWIIASWEERPATRQRMIPQWTCSGVTAQQKNQVREQGEVAGSRGDRRHSSETRQGRTLSPSAGRANGSGASLCKKKKQMVQEVLGWSRPPSQYVPSKPSWCWDASLS